MQTSMPVVNKVAAPRKEVPARTKEVDENSGPTTTVFVGNISEKASDMLIRQLLSVSSGVSRCQSNRICSYVLASLLRLETIKALLCSLNFIFFYPKFL